jgi:membrane protease YdiL (CAAX protease family)
MRTYRNVEKIKKERIIVPINPIRMPMVNEEQKIIRIGIYISVFFLVWMAWVFIYNFFVKNISADNLRLSIGSLFRFLIWVLPVFIYLKYVDKTDPFQYLKLNTNLKKGFFWSAGVVICVLILWLLSILTLNLEIKSFITISIFINWILFVAVFEEILMRGFILNKLMEITSFIKALNLTSLFFVLIHWPGWILIHTYSFTKILNASAYIFALAILLGLLIKKSESLYPCIVLHALNETIALSMN